MKPISFRGFLTVAILALIIHPFTMAQTCQSLPAPTVTHGAPNLALPGGGVLPDGDIFYLGAQRNLRFFTDTQGAMLFNFDASSVAQFGSYDGYAGTVGLGFCAVLGGSTSTTISELDSIWDINLEFASKGDTAGDKVVVYLRQPDGSGQIVLLSGTINASATGLIVDFVNLSISAYSQEVSGSLVGKVIPFTQNGGASGLRSKLTTLAIPMNGQFPMCAQLAIDVTRGLGNGKVTVANLLTVVTRDAATTDTGVGIQSHLSLSFPTARKCPVAPPTCGVVANTCQYSTCFSSPGKWSNQICFNPYSSYNYWILPPDVNTGGSTYSCQRQSGSTYSMLTCFGTGMCQTPVAQLQAEFVAAQLSSQFGLNPNFYWMREQQTFLSCLLDPAKKTSVLNVTTANGTLVPFVITGRWMGMDYNIAINENTNLTDLWLATRFALTQSQTLGGTDATDLKRTWLVNLYRALKQC